MAVRDLSVVGGASTTADAPDPVRCAALAAPLVERVFADAMREAWGAGGHELLARHGGEPAALLVAYRTALAHPGRAVTREQVVEVARCHVRESIWSPSPGAEHTAPGTGETQGATDQPGDVGVGRGPSGDARRDQVSPGDGETAWRHVGALAAAGLVEIEDDHRFRATIAGLDLLREVYRRHGEVTAARWRGHGDRVGRLVRTTGRMLAGVTTTSGFAGTAITAFGAMTPPHEPAGTPYGVLLLDRLGVLRYHRGDALAAAWRAAGLPAGQARELPAGERRDAIEAEAGRLAAAPYAAVTAGERLTFLTDLGALP